MKFSVFFLALALGAAAVFGQADAPPARDRAVTTLDDAGAVAEPDAEEEGPVIGSVRTPANSDTLRIKSPKPEGGLLADESGSISLWKLVRSGGWAMIPLGAMSILTFMLFLINFFTLRRGAILTPHYMNTADVLLKKRDYLGLLAISSRHSEAVARVVQRTLDFATKNPSAPFEVVREIAESEGSGQAAALQHRPSFLADIGMLAPMVGLLGTVFGIINSFGELAKGQTAQSRDVLLAGGVAEALVATSGGLVVGITAFAFYAYFRNKVQALISDLESASSHVLALIALNYNKKREQSRVALEDEF